jgi:hypothetical protein
VYFFRGRSMAEGLRKEGRRSITIDRCLKRRAILDASQPSCFLEATRALSETPLHG